LTGVVAVIIVCFSSVCVGLSVEEELCLDVFTTLDLAEIVYD
jgi:hypothetical protein